MGSVLLVDEVANAREVVLASSVGELPLHSRRRLWRALDDDASVKSCFLSKGHELRARLALRVADRCLVIWEDALPDISAPHDVLAAVRGYFAGELSASQLDGSKDRLWNLIVDDHGALPQPVLAGAFGVFAAAATALGDEVCAAAGVGETENELDPETWDTALWGSVARSAATPWSGGDSSARRAYWDWYLDELLRVASEYGTRWTGTDLDPDRFVAGFGPGPTFAPYVRHATPSVQHSDVLRVQRIELVGPVLFVRLELCDPDTVDLAGATRLLRALVLAELLNGRYDEARELHVEAVDAQRVLRVKTLEPWEASVR